MKLIQRRWFICMIILEAAVCVIELHCVLRGVSNIYSQHIFVNEVRQHRRAKGFWLFSHHFRSRSAHSPSSIFWWRCRWCGSGNLGDLRCRTHWRPPPHRWPGFKAKEYQAQKVEEPHTAARYNNIRTSAKGVWNSVGQAHAFLSDKQTASIFTIFFKAQTLCCIVLLTSTSSLQEFSLIHLTTHVLPLWSPDWITPYTPGSWRAWAEESTQTHTVFKAKSTHKIHTKQPKHLNAKIYNK